MSGSVIFFCLFAKGIGRPGGREKRSENLRVFTFPVRSFSPIFFSLFSLELLEMSRGLLKRPWKAMPTRERSGFKSISRAH